MYIIFLKILIVVILALRTSTANLTCLPSYGTGIDIDDCTEAMKSFVAAVPMAGGWNQLQRFSRNVNAVEKFHHMPQGFIWKTCAIGIDLLDPLSGAPPAGKVSTWEAIRQQLAILLVTCVSSQNLGGKLELHGFELVVIDPHTGVGRDTCIAQPKPLYTSLGRCIEARVRGRNDRNVIQTTNDTPPPAPPSIRPTTTSVRTYTTLAGFIPRIPRATASPTAPRRFDPLSRYSTPPGRQLHRA